ncbi:hypothetical protein HPB49_010933 [Dermacentor silvarum]|uniref:Uncharacterized protein n=1 Tax=Dermacentor silvarum TaxID=543639 RepID=A0ACB8DZ27_DERSI|nr:hypothetical protein HPB49_010933 [Dermacentor silvarum]
MLHRIQGMLSMQKSPLSTGLTQGLAGPRGRIGPTPTLKRPTPFGSAASRMRYGEEEYLEEFLLKECHADDDYVYPGLEASDDGASRVQTSGAMSETRHGIPKPSLIQTALNHYAPHEREHKSQTAASNSTGKQKTTAAKGRPQSKPKQRKRKGAPSDADVSYASDSSYVVSRGLLPWAKRREAFYYDYIRPWVEEQLWSDSDSDDKYISNASISSIIPPVGLLQSYRLKNRLIAAGGSSSSIDSEDDDMPVSPGEDLLSRGEAKFALDTLSYSTTTAAEAISMLVNFASSRRLPCAALTELVTTVNKLFAPAVAVLPSRKALVKALSEMPEVSL